MAVVPLFNEDLPESRKDEDLDVLQASFPLYDRGYLCQATYDIRRKEREWMESMWEMFAPYADNNFPVEFRSAFTQRAWELYLGATFLNRGLHLGVHNDAGPDFELLSSPGGDRIAWVEAVSVNRGNGVDGVPPLQYGLVVDVPTEAMSLRITQALQMKHVQYLERIGKNVSKDEPYVIAIDRSSLLHPENTPLILRVAYGIGNQVLRMRVPTKPGDVRDWTKAESGYQKQESIPKKSGEEISSEFFLDERHSGISAVIYSTRGILDMPRSPNEMGEHFLIVHNPFARNPIVGLFPFGEEWTGNAAGAQRIRKGGSYESPDPFSHLYT